MTAFHPPPLRRPFISRENGANASWPGSNKSGQSGLFTSAPPHKATFGSSDAKQTYTRTCMVHGVASCLCSSSPRPATPARPSLPCSLHNDRPAFLPSSSVPVMCERFHHVPVAVVLSRYASVDRYMAVRDLAGPLVSVRPWLGSRDGTGWETEPTSCCHCRHHSRLLDLVDFRRNLCYRRNGTNQQS
jgi:hypothetical protein